MDQTWTKLQGQLFAILFIYLERETGIEPATFSLGKWPSIENTEHSDSRHLLQAMEITGKAQPRFFTARMEYKWSTRDATCGDLRLRRAGCQRVSPVDGAAVFGDTESGKPIDPIAPWQFLFEICRSGRDW